MEDRYQHLLNGQSVLQADLNTLGETSALADDRVFAELFRMQPYDGSTVRKGIAPYGHAASAAAAMVAPNGATGAVLVNPFRAFVGSRTAVGDDAKKNWRDIRSAIGVGTTTLGQVVSFSANASGNPRWDLVYAAVAVDANTASVTRKRKHPTTKVVAGASVVTRLATTVTLGVQAGTADASPEWPAVPSDAGGVYYIPLAYVLIPDGFGASSTVLSTDIATVAPAVSMASSTGGKSLSVATSMYDVSTAEQQAWGSTGARKSVWMPSDLSGGETLVGVLDLSSASSGDWRPADIIDTRDWRDRLCKWMVTISSAADSTFPWSGTPTLGPFSGTPLTDAPDGTNLIIATGLTQTLHQSGGGNPYIANIIGSHFDFMDDGAVLIIYVDAATGQLRYTATGAPGVTFAYWLEFSGPFANK